MYFSIRHSLFGIHNKWEMENGNCEWAEGKKENIFHLKAGSRKVFQVFVIYKFILNFTAFDEHFLDEH